MRKLKFVLLLLFSATLSIAAHASDFPDTDSIDAKYFTDWITLSDLLHTKNINIHGVNWSGIERACLSLKTEDDQTLYNRCKFEKAYLAQQYPMDSDSCNARTLAQYPDELAQPQVTRSYAVDNKNRLGKSTLDVGQPLYSTDELQTIRGNAYTDCMHAIGWVDANDWMAGKRALPPIIPASSHIMR